MEADWSIECGSDSPLIVVPWSAPGEDDTRPRFIDLRSGDAHLLEQIPETSGAPALRDALLRLNSPDSPFWTVKCDVWSHHEPADAYEMNAEPEDVAFATGSYIDLLPRDSRINFAGVQRWVKMLAKKLHTIPATAARVELVVRPARVDGIARHGVTWFVQGCGATPERAMQAWSEALLRSLAAIDCSPM